MSPRVLIVDDEPLQRAFAGQVLEAVGWSAIAADSVEATCSAWIAPVHLVLLDLHLPGLDPKIVLPRFRALPVGAAVPVVAFTTTRLKDTEPLLAIGFDDVLAKPCTPGELMRCAARWRPRAPGAATVHLHQIFGHAEIDPLLARFRDLLAEALAALASGRAEALAHRVSGIAGTLGFAAVGAAWLQHSEQGGDPADLRRLTRLAIGEIDRVQEPAP